MKITHEIRDPVHVFVRVSTDERGFVDKPAVQRLRHIHQLAMSYLVYPGASHKRFEHSLGVMELASRAYDVIIHPENIHPRVAQMFPEINQADKRDYWRSALRMAGLFHDVGHIPFSHASEKDLLPKGCTHETITARLIDELEQDFAELTPPLRAMDVKKLAVGPKELAVDFSTWEAILAEIIVGDSFGVDRMDYLLRDSLHTGVVYGKFDHYRLIDCLRILPKEYIDSEEPSLGVTEGGLQSAEALQLARYFMYSQVYFHPVRRIYDIHLRDFMTAWCGKLSADPVDHQKLSDNEVLSELALAAADEEHPGHSPAKCIVKRQHFKVVYQREPGDLELHPEPGRVLYDALISEFGEEVGRRFLRYDGYAQKESGMEFPVQMRDGTIVSSVALSQVLSQIPLVAVEYIFAADDVLSQVKSWLDKNKEDVLKEAGANV